MFSFIKNIFIIVAVLLTGALGYYLYMNQSGALEDTSNGGIDQNVALQTTEFLRRLNELKAIELNDAIFSDPRFSSLTNFATPLQSEPYGTSNPFELN